MHDGLFLLRLDFLGRDLVYDMAVFKTSSDE